MLLLAAIQCIESIVSYHICSDEDGGGVCPTGNTCCPIPGKPGESYCITTPAHADSPGSCCTDLHFTGCGPGYKCGTYRKRFAMCLRENPTDTEKPDHLQRYRLCNLPSESLKTIHTIRIRDGGHLAYYSTKLSIDSKHLSKLTTRIIFVIHGSGRNADDYLCCTSEIMPRAQRNNTLLIAPRFLAPADGPQRTKHDVPLLRWNETDPIAHTWRYGADALNSNISSFEAMDRFVELVIERFHRLEQVIVIGHSAGGQFVHRWALTSTSPVWKDGKVPIRVVVGNPRSYAYLDNRRFDSNGNYTVPATDRILKCPTYNTWEWGLETQGSRLPAPYVERALAVGPEVIRKQYAERDVRYLLGMLDILHVQSECEDDEFQGPNRYHRGVQFFQSLPFIYGKQIHFLVQNIGTPHDHCLLFQSPGGSVAMFGFEEAVKQHGLDAIRSTVEVVGAGMPLESSII